MCINAMVTLFIGLSSPDTLSFWEITSLSSAMTDVHRQ
jgi:hypothetical protein